MSKRNAVIIVGACVICLFFAIASYWIMERKDNVRCGPIPWIPLAFNQGKESGVILTGSVDKSVGKSVEIIVNGERIGDVIPDDNGRWSYLFSGAALRNTPMRFFMAVDARGCVVGSAIVPGMPETD